VDSKEHMHSHCPNGNIVEPFLACHKNGAKFWPLNGGKSLV